MSYLILQRKNFYFPINKQSQGWAITHYCSACNDPKGSELGNKNNILQIGDCAINNSHGFKFGRTITIGGRNYRVADHCESKVCLQCQINWINIILAGMNIILITWFCIFLE
ncbi:hypothetical protein pb186bvf_013263 [Paramecium bursaria]